MTKIMRITVVVFAVLILAANMPLCAFATDPVSAATMANAAAQAISAYGASQGVSMTFDVASTAGIGEGVHELWDQFKEDIQDNNVPTYDSLAITMWADVYTKVGNNVGIFIDDTVMPFIDAFWNWLLSGPAEMQKVDDYYQWQIDVQTGEVNPINVYSDYNIGLVPLISNYTTLSTQEIYNLSKPVYHQATSNYRIFCSNGTMAVVAYNPAGNPYQILVGASVQDSYSYTTRYYLASYDNAWHFSGPNNFTYNSSSQSLGNGRYIYTGNYNSLYTSSNVTFDVPMYESYTDALNALKNYFIDPAYAVGDQLSVRPYIGDSVPQDVFIPDNDDVNYAPLPYVGGLDIPWDNTLYGDGSGTLTDAQSEAISGVVDDAITNSLEKTLTLAETDNPSPPVSEVYIPLLPVELPNFNFSLSGIWHYVVSWVQSLGAWLSLMFQAWAVLPSAITIPVYASAVIVIVLGVYKRFFM